MADPIVKKLKTLSSVCGSLELVYPHMLIMYTLGSNIRASKGVFCGTIKEHSRQIEPPCGGRRLERRAVSYQAETPFDSIEGSHEYIALLAEALDEARRDVEAEVAAADRDGAERRKEALLLVSFNLAKLNLHITTSRRILNDLRSLRRLLLAERGLLSETQSRVRTAGGGE